MIGVLVVALLFRTGIEVAGKVSLARGYAIPVPDIASDMRATPAPFCVDIVIPIRVPSRVIGFTIRAIDLAETSLAIVEAVVITGDEARSVALFVLILVSHVALVPGIGIFYLRLELVVMR